MLLHQAALLRALALPVPTLRPAAPLLPLVLLAHLRRLLGWAQTRRVLDPVLVRLQVARQLVLVPQDPP